ncbi:hypothetical protein Tco_0093969, partial [Tanacetum coccineum]
FGTSSQTSLVLNWSYPWDLGLVLKCIFLGYHKDIVDNQLWRLDDVTSKIMLYRNIGFNESGEYKKTFIGSSVGTGSVQVLQGVEFEVEPREDHAFEVETLRNVGKRELFSYREDCNEAAFIVAVVEKIYAHESLTFNDIVACEVISKWKAGLKEDTDARLDVYVLSNSCTKSSNDIYGYYWEYTPGLLDEAKGNILGMEIFRSQSGNTLRVLQSRVYNGKLVQTLLDGHSILSGDCDVKKNAKWSYICS